MGLDSLEEVDLDDLDSCEVVGPEIALRAEDQVGLDSLMILEELPAHPN